MAASAPTIVNRRARHDYFIDESYECGIALAGESVRPADFRRLGVAFAVAATVLFAVRDNLLRRLAEGTDAPALVTAPKSGFVTMKFHAPGGARVRSNVADRVVPPFVTETEVPGISVWPLR